MLKRRDKEPKDTRFYVHLKWKDKNIVCLVNLTKAFYMQKNLNSDRLVKKLLSLSYPQAVNLFNKKFKNIIDVIHS